MTQPDMEALAKQLVRELQATLPQAIASGRLASSFTDLAAAACCEGHCPCDSRNGGTCPCASKCGCDGKIAHRDEMDWVTNLAQLPDDQIRRVLDAVPVIQQLRNTTRKG